MEFKKVFDQLNSAQKEAVMTTEGPVLVVAGPGTGKTQLLSARVAQILKTTDASPSNILCLTFTDAGAYNMRERLSAFIGKDAYSVTMNTYHAFGDSILKRYAHEYLPELRLKKSLDELRMNEQILQIVETFSPRHPLRTAVYNSGAGALSQLIADFKKARLTPEKLRAIATANERTLNELNISAAEFFSVNFKMPRNVVVAIELFEQIFETLLPYRYTTIAKTPIQSLGALFFEKIQAALDLAREQQKTQPLTACKNELFEKNAQNCLVFAGQKATNRLFELADLFEKHQAIMDENGLYDYGDMIGRAIELLKKNDEVRYALQEQYQYILLDEFQDTNEAQAELVHLLCDNPVNENRPNVLAVGDDDQAIYAFQGALFSNMRQFAERYRDTKIISLTENYRSHAKILELSKNLTAQLSSKLFEDLTGEKKQLNAANIKIEDCTIERSDFLSEEAEYAFVAEKIQSLIASGVSPKEIAVIAKKHAPLETLAPHLGSKNIPVSYTKRDNILETPHIRWILQIIRLLIELRDKNPAATARIPEILSYPFWNLPTRDIWLLNFSYDKERWRKNTLSLATFGLENATPEIQQVLEFLISLSFRVDIDALETMLGYILGSAPLNIGEEEYSSGFIEWAKKQSPSATYDIMSQLNVLRSVAKQQQEEDDEHVLTVGAILDLVKRYEAASMNLLNTSPYTSAAEAVELLTAHKAKGLEFSHVFILNTSDDSWGNNRRPSDNLKLPDNLLHIRYAGDGEDELIRLFFVAVTRAKTNLYLTRYEKKHDGKDIARLRFLGEIKDEKGCVYAKNIPEPFSLVKESSKEAPAVETLQESWQDRHFPPYETATLTDLLRTRLEKFQLSASHINTFLDVDRDGPHTFLLQTLLRFPVMIHPAAEFGTAIHSALEVAQNLSNAKKKTEEHIETVLEAFRKKIQQSTLSEDERAHYRVLGEDALPRYILTRKEMFAQSAKTELDFRSAGSFVGEAHLSGKIDRFEINESTKTIRVADYKTGKFHQRFSESDPKMLKYERQLYFYKILIESSDQWRGYTVSSARLEYIEPDEYGVIAAPLEIDFLKNPEKTAEKIKELQAIITAVWNSVKTLTLPDVSAYAGQSSAKGTKAFISHLLVKE